MSEIEAKRVFIGAGCNRIVNNISWGASDLVSFGAQNAVAIFSPKTAQILTTLPGHQAAVNCTHWLPSSKFAFKALGVQLNTQAIMYLRPWRHYLLSGDANGTIILWEFSVVDKKWRLVLNLPQSHKKGVTCITGIIISQTEAMFASTSSDGTVSLWNVVFPSSVGGDCKLSCLQSLSVGSKPMVALSMAELPGDDGNIVMAMGGLDNKIHIYTGEKTGKFIHACELKAHSDWIRSLDFSLPVQTNGEKNSILLVSSSQDKCIRIWKITPRDSQDMNPKAKISLSSYIDGPMFFAGSSSYQVSMESLLAGHEDWAYSVQWQPPFLLSEDGIVFCQPQSILSASMDKTMMIWQPEKTTGIWMNVVTVGELGHCALGFYGGHWSPDGLSILAHAYGGAFHLWRNVDVDDWRPQKVPCGHFGPVSDISWARSGEYLLSVSHDQTTRIFAPWRAETCLTDEGSWHEIARPQVHGHDINCVTIIQGKGNHRFVCGADEKVARVLEAPLSFLKTLNHATCQESSFPDDMQAGVQILGAKMSALGLSQKPISVQSANEIHEVDENEGFDTLETIPTAIPVEFMEVPIEDQLAWHTLWPETHKLYGHGNELFSLCCDNDGKLVASSCKAQTAAVAEIWLWEVGSWKAVGRLKSHTLTVTQMEFCHDSNLLLAVSRDRQFSVFTIKRTGTGDIEYQLLARQEAHKRIIWTCSWNPFGHEFATGSRDKTVKIWAVENESSVKQVLTLPPFKSSVTALSWVGLVRQSNSGCLAVGMENGGIELWSISLKRNDNSALAVEGVSASLISRFDSFMCHASAVSRLAWRHCEKREDSGRLQLASCGEDNCVRVFEINFA